MLKKIGLIYLVLTVLYVNAEPTIRAPLATSSNRAQAAANGEDNIEGRASIVPLASRYAAQIRASEKVIPISARKQGGPVGNRRTAPVRDKVAPQVAAAATASPAVKIEAPLEAKKVEAAVVPLATKIETPVEQSITTPLEAKVSSPVQTQALVVPQVAQVAAASSSSPVEIQAVKIEAPLEAEKVATAVVPLASKIETPVEEKITPLEAQVSSLVQTQASIVPQVAQVAAEVVPQVAQVAAEVVPLAAKIQTPVEEKIIPLKAQVSSPESSVVPVVVASSTVELIETPLEAAKLAAAVVPLEAKIETPLQEEKIVSPETATMTSKKTATSKSQEAALNTKKQKVLESLNMLRANTFDLTTTLLNKLSTSLSTHKHAQHNNNQHQQSEHHNQDELHHQQQEQQQHYDQQPQQGGAARLLSVVFDPTVPISETLVQHARIRASQIAERLAAFANPEEEEAASE